jgi:hypothetical protein
MTLAETMFICTTDANFYPDIRQIINALQVVTTNIPIFRA